MKSKAQQHFEEQRKREIMLELLYANYLTYRAANNTRANTNTLVWFVVIGIVISFVVSLFSILAVT